MGGIRDGVVVGVGVVVGGVVVVACSFVDSCSDSGFGDVELTKIRAAVGGPEMGMLETIATNKNGARTVFMLRGCPPTI